MASSSGAQSDMVVEEGRDEDEHSGEWEHRSHRIRSYAVMSPIEEEAAAMKGSLLLQKFTLVESASHIFVIGGNKSRSAFLLLEIGRKTTELNVKEHPDVFASHEEALACVRKRCQENGQAQQMSQPRKFYALLGFIRIMECVHMLLVTRKRKVGSLGGHYVYAIEETQTLAVQAQDFLPRHEKKQQAIRDKNKELFDSVDLSKGFYFSYGYDITHSLQYNQEPSSAAARARQQLINRQLFALRDQQRDDASSSSRSRHRRSDSADQRFRSGSRDDSMSIYVAAAQSHRSPEVVDGERTMSGSSFVRSKSNSDASHSPSRSLSGIPPPGSVASYSEMFLWNFYLVQEFLISCPEGSHWLAPLVHGFFSQATLRIGHQSFVLTLIARRSRHFAGTRYMRRGVDRNGHVANEVETEQIVHHMDAWCGHGGVSSVVMLRGSIPLLWSQPNPLSPKPDILVHQQNDPVCTGPRRHFDRLYRRYGAPIHILSLIRQQEKQPKETTLGEAYTRLISAINKDLTENLSEYRLRYSCYDFLQQRKERANVMQKLALLARGMLQDTGLFFQSHLPLSDPTLAVRLRHSGSKFGSSMSTSETAGPTHVRGHSVASSVALEETRDKKVRIESLADRQPVSSDIVSSTIGYVIPRLKWLNLSITDLGGVSRCQQRGIIRVNCIDCLDRTNVAQYTIGKTALPAQLQLLGVGEDELKDAYPELGKLMARIYTLHGDQIAKQYGGSAAMHKVAFMDNSGEEEAPKGKSKGTAASLAANALSAVRRYYSNNITDATKQHAISIFLGHYVPKEGRPQIWELNPATIVTHSEEEHGHRYDRFKVPCASSFLPVMPLGSSSTIAASSPTMEGRERTRALWRELFSQRYNPRKLTSFNKTFQRDFAQTVILSRAQKAGEAVPETVPGAVPEAAQEAASGAEALLSPRSTVPAASVSSRSQQAAEVSESSIADASKSRESSVVEVEESLADDTVSIAASTAIALESDMYDGQSLMAAAPPPSLSLEAASADVDGDATKERAAPPQAHTLSSSTGGASSEVAPRAVTQAPDSLRAQPQQSEVTGADSLALVRRDPLAVIQPVLHEHSMGFYSRYVDVDALGSDDDLLASWTAGDSHGPSSSENTSAQQTRDRLPTTDAMARVAAMITGAATTMPAHVSAAGSSSSGAPEFARKVEDHQRATDKRLSNVEYKLRLLEQELAKAIMKRL